MDDADQTQRGPDGRRTKRFHAILAAALDEFSANGFAMARLDDVAKRARVAKGTIYLYFDSKEDLFRAVVRELIVPMVTDLSEQIDRFEGPSEELIRHMVAALRLGLAKPGVRAIVRLVIAEAGRFPDLAEFYYREVVSRGMAAIRKVIARGVARGEFRHNPVETFPQLFVGPMLVTVVWQELFDRFDPLDLDALLDAHIDVLIHGIGGPRS